MRLRAPAGEGGSGSVALAIGVDVGGTKVAAGVVDDDGHILARLRRPTPSLSPADTAATVAELVAQLRDGHPVAAVGIGAAGFIDAERSTVLFAPNLAWRREPLRDRVAEQVGLPVVVENDANAMAWAEHKFGGGRGEPYLVAVTIGTGIGGGLVLGGRLYRGRWGLGAEVGHMRVVPDGRRCGCGNRGCWEQYCSGRALTREARELAAVSPAATSRLLELAGGDIEKIFGPEITQAAREGDPTAIECFTEIGTWLGQGLADLAAILDPGAFVVGGGVAEAGELLLDPARRRFAAALTGRGHRPMPAVRAARLGNDAGLVGAADLARLPG
jgi:glucokinase